MCGSIDGSLREQGGHSYKVSHVLSDGNTRQVKGTLKSLAPAALWVGQEGVQRLAESPYKLTEGNVKP